METNPSSTAEQINLLKAEMESYRTRIDECRDKLRPELERVNEEIQRIRNYASVRSRLGDSGEEALEKMRIAIQAIRDDYDDLPLSQEISDLQEKFQEASRKMGAIQSVEDKRKFDEQLILKKEEVEAVRAEIDERNEQAYQMLDALHKKHIQPLKEYGMTDQGAQQSLDGKIKYAFKNVESTIHWLEMIEMDFKDIEKDIASGQLPSNYRLTNIKERLARQPRLRDES